MADAKRGREDDESGERAKKISRRSELSALKIKATEELNALKRNDPQAIADLEKELELVKNAANRWTDNIFACKDYLVKKRGMDKKETMKILGITDAFDCECDVVVALLFCFSSSQYEYSHYIFLFFVFCYVVH